MATRAASRTKTKKTAKKTATKPAKKAKRQAVARAKAPAKTKKKATKARGGAAKKSKATKTSRPTAAKKGAKKTAKVVAKKPKVAAKKPKVAAKAKMTTKPTAKGAGKTAKKTAKAKAPAAAGKARVAAKAAPKPKSPRKKPKAKAAAADHELAPMAAGPVGPAVGDPAPDFDLATDEGQRVALHDFVGQHPVVLYFYPKADTPGCTRQACDFRDGLTDFAEHGAVVIGVSPDPVEDLAAFRSKFNLTFPLGSDESTTVAQAYGVWVEKTNYGRTYMGIQRATFLIGRDGNIAAAWPKVSVDGHADEVLQALKGLASETPSAGYTEESYGSH